MNKIEKLLPNGTILTAELNNDPNYPGIQISVKKSETDATGDIVCVVEFDTTKPSGKELCARVYTSDQDEPSYSVGYLDKDDIPENNSGAVDILGREPSFRYQLLNRLKSDCDYYLGCGSRSPHKLWALDEKNHIAIMKSLWNSFSDDEKPEWLTWEQIMAYEKEMLNTVS